MGAKTQEPAAGFLLVQSPGEIGLHVYLRPGAEAGRTTAMRLAIAATPGWISACRTGSISDHEPDTG